MNKLISETISFLRFPLCCAVVLHHSGVPHYDIRELISQTFFSELMAGNKKPYVDYTLYDYFDALFSISREMPLDYPLWFIKDLMVVVVLTPIIYYLLKHFHLYFLTVFSLLYILAPLIDIPLPFCSSILFFSLGACLSIKKVDFLPQLVCCLFRMM